jgi:hypothetical protein
MNKLYSCSWVQNTGIITENYQSKAHLINESIAKILKGVKKKMEAANIGIPYRDASLYFLKFLQEKRPNLIPDDFKARWSTSKPQAKDINAMMGQIIMDENLPKDFLDKLGKDLEDYNDIKHKIGDTEVDNVTAFLNNLAGFRETRGVKIGEEPKEKYGSAKDIQAAVTAGPAKERVKKGASGYETITMNLDPETTLDFDDESPAGFPIYTTIKDGLKYRVTLKDADGKPIKVSSLSPENIASVVVTEPYAKQQVQIPSPNELEDIGTVEREKSVSDNPPFPPDDYSSKDPEDAAYGVENLIDDEDEDEENLQMNIKSITPGGKSVLKSYLKNLSKDIDGARSNNTSMMPGKANTPLPVEDEEKPADEMAVSNGEEDCEMIVKPGEMHIKRPSPEHARVVAQTHAEIDRRLREQYRERMQHAHKIQQRYHLGY